MSARVFRILSRVIALAALLAGCSPTHVERTEWTVMDTVAAVQWKTGADGKERTHVTAYEWLDKAGFEQVPTGSNFSCDTNFADTVKFCDSRCDRTRIKGYLMAPWTRTFCIHHDKSFAAIAQLEAARKARG